VIKSDGTVARHDYLPFGEEIPSSVGGRSSVVGYSTADDTRQKFTQKERDSESGLDYFGARYYSGPQGRFTTADNFLNDAHASDPQSWNNFAYVRNNPLNYIDPTGQIIENTGDRRHKLTESQLKAIRDDLRKKTGLKSIDFAKKTGRFSYDSKEVASGGSTTLRQTITGAIDDSKNVFQLNDYSGSQSVNFAEGDPGTVDSTTRVTTYQIKIDFADYADARNLSDSDAFASFSLGLNLFHEIDHKVSYDSSDPIDSRIGFRDDLTRTIGGVSVRGVIERENIVRSQLGLISRDPGTHAGTPYTGNDPRFRGTHQIPFTDASGQAKFIRWKLESAR